MKLPIYQVDAFTDRIFTGNPAAVCVLERWLPDPMLLAIAGENNLSDTAFVVRQDPGFGLRWFTPEIEVDLCGHATLAAAFVIFEKMELEERRVLFDTKSGPLAVEREGDLLCMDLPSRPGVAHPILPELTRGLKRAPKQVLKARDLMAVFDSEDEVRNLEPDLVEFMGLDCLGVIATAPGNDCDFVSRFFAPRAGIDEDPVTGSSHCTLVPYWAGRLGKPKLRAKQVSARGGELWCQDCSERVRIAGRAVMFLEGCVFAPDPIE